MIPLTLSFMRDSYEKIIDFHPTHSSLTGRASTSSKQFLSERPTFSRISLKKITIVVNFAIYYRKRTLIHILWHIFFRTNLDISFIKDIPLVRKYKWLSYLYFDQSHAPLVNGYRSMVAAIPGESRKYIRLMSHDTASIASILKI